MTDGEILMYGITAGALLMTTGVMVGAIAVSKFGRHGESRDRDDGVPIDDSPPPTEKPKSIIPPMAKWREARAKKKEEKKEKPRQSVINLEPVVNQVEEDSILIDVEKANGDDDDSIEATVAEPKTDKPPLCAICHKRGKNKPWKDGKHYCGKHELEQEEKE